MSRRPRAYICAMGCAMGEPAFLRGLIAVFGHRAVVACHRVKLPRIVGFLITGVLRGADGFGLIEGIAEVEAMAEIRFVLLLFTVGVEFSL